MPRTSGKIRTKNWFEREFPFDQELWLYPAIVERLRGAPVRLEERMHGIPPSLRTRRIGESWSVQEHAGHLWDLESLWRRRVEDFHAGKAVLEPADLENRKTHEANHNQAPLETLLDAFRNERERLVEELERFDREGVARTARHPRLDQPMRVIDLAFFVAEHDDHHLAKITEVLADLGDSA